MITYKIMRQFNLFGINDTGAVVMEDVSIGKRVSPVGDGILAEKQRLLDP